MSRVMTHIMFAVSMVGLFGCATSTVESDAAPYFDAAYNDHNRAPASVTPPVDAADSTKRVDASNQRALADYHFAVGEAHSFENRHTQAIESFKTVLIYDPDSIQVRLRLAAEYIKIGSNSEALHQAEEAVNKDSKKPEAHLLLAGLYSSLKNFPRSIAEYEQTLKLDPKNTDAMMYLGAVHAERKEYDKAISYFETLAKEESYSHPHAAYYYMGRIREDQGTGSALKAAEGAYKKALELKADYSEAAIALAGYYTRQKKSAMASELLKQFQRNHGPNLKVAEILSSLYLQEEKYELALEQLEVLESDPDESLNIKVKTALIYIDQKLYPKAAAKLNEVLKLAPDSDKIRFYLAAVYEEMGDAPKAIEHFSQVPPVSQFYQDSIVHAAYLLKESKNYSAAVELVEKALQERKDVPQFFAVYASLVDGGASLDKAIALLDDGIKKFPDYVQLRFFLGTLFDRQGQKTKSLEQMRKVVEMDPNHVQGLNYLAFTLADLDQELDHAEKLVKRALEMEPKDGFILDTYGWILFKRGQSQDAVRVLERAHQFQPQESVIAEHLGDAYYRLQLLDKARRMYEKAVQHSADESKSNEIRSKITSIEKQEYLGLNSSRQPASVGPVAKPTQTK